MRLVACGDIALFGEVEKRADADMSSIFSNDLTEIIRGSDLSIANLECPLTDSKDPAWKHDLALKGRRNLSEILRVLGVDVVSLANNHICDYGICGLKDTISVLRDKKIDYVGAGFNIEEAARPLVITKDNVRIGILALAQRENSAAEVKGWGAGLLDRKKVISAIKNLVRRVDLCIAFFHFGIEFSKYPTPSDVDLCRNLIDAGCSLVIGHHPHVIQGFEWYRSGFIAYSLGNFIFDMEYGPDKYSRLGIILVADWGNGKLKNIDVVPVTIVKGIPRLVTGRELESTWQHMHDLCKPLQEKESLKKYYYFVCRDNLFIHLKALLFYGIGRRNIRRAFELIVSQLWPQIFALRVDFVKFLFSGRAADYEMKKDRISRSRKTRFWLLFCKICGQSYRVFNMKKKIGIERSD